MIENEKLMAYADGELTPSERAEIEAAIAHDPALAAEVEKHRVLRAKLTRAFAPIVDDAPPQRLVDIARGPAKVEIVDLAAVRAKRMSFATRVAALAAMFAAGLFVGVGVLSERGNLAADSNGLVARGDLARTLDVQLASETARDAPIRIGLSFRDQDGAFCRTYTADNSEGLACREERVWRIEVAIRAQQTEYAQAGASPVMQAVDARIDGEALDADAERAARDAGW